MTIKKSKNGGYSVSYGGKTKKVGTKSAATQTRTKMLKKKKG
jgi:hypothetical protein